MLNPTPSNSTSKGTLGKPKNGGFRSTIRRIFGSKRQRDASPTEKVNHIHAVSQPAQRRYYNSRVVLHISFPPCDTALDEPSLLVSFGQLCHVRSIPIQARKESLSII